MGKEEREPRALVCQGVSRWDEPCALQATRHCERCDRRFCQAHFADPEWHSCAEEAR